LKSDTRPWCRVLLIEIAGLLIQFRQRNCQVKVITFRSVKKILSAFATDDGKRFTENHFGDAKFYDIYEISDSECKFFKRIENTTGDGEKHADPEKAGCVARLLNEEGVKFIVSKKYGPNLKRIKKKFVAVIIHDLEIAGAVTMLQGQLERLTAEFEKGESREFLNMKEMKSPVHEYDIAVIGGGPAGITLAKMLGKKLKMAVIRPEDHSMIYCAMPYVIEGLIDCETTLKKDALVTDAGAELIRETVRSIDFDSKSLTLDQSGIRYKKLIIATGAMPFIPPIPGSDLEGVSGFKTGEDLNRILDLVKNGLESAVVVGAGAIGIELALALNSRSIDVHLVDIATSPLPNLADSDMTDGIRDEIAKCGIHLHLGAKVTELKGDGQVREVVMDNGGSIHLSSLDDCTVNENGGLKGIVIFSVGVKPSLSLVEGTQLEIGRDGIIVNERMETNLKDVYAVGDCVQFSSGITGDVIPGKLATNAVPMAKVLGFNLIGKDRHYPGFYNGAATKVGKFFIGGTGFTENAAKICGFDVVCGYSEVTTKFPIIPGTETISVKLVADRKSHKLIGAQIVSGEPVTGRIDLLTFAIQKESTIEDLTSLSYSAQPYQSFYPAANSVVLAAEDIIKQL